MVGSAVVIVGVSGAPVGAGVVIAGTGMVVEGGTGVVTCIVGSAVPEAVGSDVTIRAGVTAAVG